MLPFLDQVQERESAVGVLLGHRHHEAQVGLGQLLARPVGLARSDLHRLLAARELVGGFADRALELLQLQPRRPQLVGFRFRAGGGAQVVDAQLRLPQRADGRIEPVGEFLPHVRRELDGAHGARDRHAGPEQALGSALRDVAVAAHRGGGPVLAPHQLLEQRLDALDVRHQLRLARGELLLRQLVVRHDDDVAQLALAAPDPPAQLDDAARHDRALRQGRHDAALAALDALGDGDLALPREQRHPAHLPQVGPHQVLALVGFLAGRVDLALRDDPQRRVRAGFGLELIGRAFHFDAVVLDFLQQQREVVRVDVRSDVLDDLVDGHEAAFLARGNQLPYQIVAFLRQQIGSSRVARTAIRRRTWSGGTNMDPCALDAPGGHYVSSDSGSFYQQSARIAPPFLRPATPVLGRTRAPVQTRRRRGFGAQPQANVSSGSARACRGRRRARRCRPPARASAPSA